MRDFFVSRFALFFLGLFVAIFGLVDPERVLRALGQCKSFKNA